MSATNGRRWRWWLGALAVVAGLVVTLVMLRGEEGDSDGGQTALQQASDGSDKPLRSGNGPSVPKLLLQRPPVEPVAQQQPAWKELPLCRNLETFNLELGADGKPRGVWMSENQGAPALVLLGARYGQFALVSIEEDGPSRYARVQAPDGACRSAVGSREPIARPVNAPVQAQEQQPAPDAQARPHGVRDLALRLRELTGRLKGAQATAGGGSSGTP